MERQGAALKVVVHLEDGLLVKGFFDGAEGGSQAPLSHSGSLLDSRIQLEQPAGKKISVDLGAAKAVFFVKDFDGNPRHQEVKFFHAEPDAEGLWVRVRFNDNETIEGVARNSLDFLVGSGFFLKPPDPESNNQMIYVLKRALQEFQVLGLRSDCNLR